MTFDPTINAGNLFLMAMGVIAFIGGWYKFGGCLDMLEYRVKAVEDTMRIMAAAMEKQVAAEKLLALIDQRVVAVEGLAQTLNKEISDLRRGDGWITKSSRTTVEGEY
jgi:ABC-type Fe3+-hydroxamate transport system substrate-binding protein